MHHLFIFWESGKVSRFYKWMWPREFDIRLWRPWTPRVVQGEGGVEDRVLGQVLPRGLTGRFQGIEENIPLMPGKLVNLASYQTSIGMKWGVRLVSFIWYKYLESITCWRVPPASATCIHKMVIFFPLMMLQIRIAGKIEVQSHGASWGWSKTYSFWEDDVPRAL